MSRVKEKEKKESESYEVTELNVILFSFLGQALFRSGSPREFHEASRASKLSSCDKLQEGRSAVLISMVQG